MTEILFARLGEIPAGIAPTDAPTFTGGVTILTDHVDNLVLRNTLNQPGEFFSIEAGPTTAQFGNSGTHLYVSDQDFQISRGMHQDWLIYDDLVLDDPLLGAGTTGNHQLMEFGQAGLQNYTAFSTQAGPPGVATISIASPAVVTLNNHGIKANHPLYFVTTGALPTGITATPGPLWPNEGGAWQTGIGTLYYAKTILGANTFTISATPGGPAINTSGSQSGVHTLVAGMATSAWYETPTAGDSNRLFRATALYQDTVDPTTLISYTFVQAIFVDPTPSTSATTGSVTIVGGLGVGGDIFTTGNLSSTKDNPGGSLGFTFINPSVALGSNVAFTMTSGNVSYFASVYNQYNSVFHEVLGGHLSFQTDTAGKDIYFQVDALDTPNFLSLYSTGQVEVDATITSTSPSTGAFRVFGGAGIGENLNVGGTFTVTGIGSGPTAAVDTNTTQFATTAFVLAQASAVNPIVDGTVAIGTSKRYARADHVHPTDTSRAPTASPTFTGTISAAALTLSGVLTYGGVALSAAVTGTGNMALSISPTFTGTPLAPTAAVDTNTTQIATTAFVLAQAGSANPIVDGTVAVGTSTRFARQDHVHPTDTSRAPTASPTFTGTITAAIANFSGAVGVSSTLTVTSTSASALAVGRQGATNPVLQVDASTATVLTGLKIKGAGTGGGVAISVVEAGGTNNNLTIDAMGTGTITFGGTSTGANTFTRASTFSAAITYGGVALNNAVTGTGNMVLSTNPTMSTPILGVATGTSLAVSGLLTSSGGGIGYATGAGGTVTQATSKATGVTLSKFSGAITMNAAALAAATIVSFVLTNTNIAATDVLVLNHISGGTIGSYTLNAQAAAGTATINVRNNTAGSLSDAIVIQFVLIKGVNA